jgi:hypothetical protein
VAYKTYKWTVESYRAAIQGGDGMPGLRSLVRGFEAAEGYDLRNIASWTGAQKRRVQHFYKSVKALEAQPRMVVRPRDPEHLKALQRAFHGEHASKHFKAALVNYTPPKHPSGTKSLRPKINYKKGAVEIVQKGYVRRMIIFDPMALAKNPRREVQRVLDETPNARLFFVQMGEYQSLAPKEGDTVIADQILRLLNKYDGITRVRGKGSDWRPEDHDARDWIKGIISYEFTGGLTVTQAVEQIRAAKYNQMVAREMHDAAVKGRIPRLDTLRKKFAKVYLKQR